MGSLKHLVYGYDGFDHPAPIPDQVVALAERNDAALHLVNVLPPVPVTTWRSARISPEEVQRSLVETRTTVLEQEAEKIRRPGFTVQTHVLEGSPAPVLIRYVMEVGAEVLAVRARNNRSRSRAFGHVAAKLLRKCPCTVLAVRSGRKSVSRVMAAVELAPEGHHAPDMEDRVVACARTLAGEGELCVFHAWSLWGERTLRGSCEVPPDEVDRLCEDHASERSRRLRDLLARNGLRREDVRVVLAKGRPEHVIPPSVSAHGVDVLVLGSVARSGLAGVLIGNTAERLLNRVSCSVAVVKPVGFVCPFRPAHA